MDVWVGLMAGMDYHHDDHGQVIAAGKQHLEKSQVLLGTTIIFIIISRIQTQTVQSIRWNYLGPRHPLNLTKLTGLIGRHS